MLQLSVKADPRSRYDPFLNLYAIVIFLIGGDPVRTTTSDSSPEKNTKAAIVRMKHTTKNRIKDKITKSDIVSVERNDLDH